MDRIHDLTILIGSVDYKCDLSEAEQQCLATT